MTLTSILGLISILILLLTSLIVAGHLIVQTGRRFVLHLIVIASYIVLGIGGFFKILHWTGADELLLFSNIGYGAGGCLLIWTGLRNPTKQLLHFQFMCGIIISLIALNMYFPLYQYHVIIAMLPYPLAALSATIILNKTYVHTGERNMLILYFLNSTLGILVSVVLDFSHKIV